VNPGLTPELTAALRKRVALRFFAIGVAVDATVIGAFLLNPEWARYFYASQFPVLSKLIFGVFFAGLLITYRNFVRLLVEEKRLREAGQLLAAGATPQDLLEQLAPCGVRDRVQGLLARPEHAGAGDPSGRDALEAREETHAGWAKYISATLTMLGLLGTFLGLMVAIDSIRGLTALADKEAFFVGVVGALDGMGTAFSTSLAGIFGAVVLGFEQLVFHFAQLSFLTRLQLLVERVLGPAVEHREDGAGLAVELHRFRQDLRAWRTDAGAAGAELQAAATELGGQVRALGDSVGSVLEAVATNDDRWREVREELATLRRVALEENQSLLALAGHRLGGLEQEVAGVEAAAAGAGETEDAPSGPPDEQSLAELRRSNDLLGHIYREMGLVLRSAGQRVELKQTETLQSISRLIQRMDAQQASGAEQIQLLRTLLRYLNDDDRKMVGVLGVLRDEARRDDE